ncbi:MAG: GNAT family N-acetyltransferase [Myxococcaceae bacterium]|nr:GNAT family N-acetyltransferase [Myxococcaceae bacterium]
MSVRLLYLRPDGLGPYLGQLAALERDISYPIADGKDRFVISHGAEYHPFFSGLGEAHFLLALHGDEVIGCVAGARRRVLTPGGAVMGGYVGDLKLRRDWRGKGVPARILSHALALSLRRWRELHWRFAFGAAMRGDRGDVMRAAKGANVMKLSHAHARLDLYFVPPEQLAALDVTRAPATPASKGMDLSPDTRDDVVSTAGRKDFVLQSTGKPWTLVHLPRGPSGWGSSHAAYLRRGGERLVREGAPGPVCFGLDQRLTAERAFLGAQGLTPGAVATVYALSTTTKSWGAAWTHLATSEI